MMEDRHEALRRSAQHSYDSYDFKRQESWRWTPADIMLQPRPLVASDYEFVLADGIGEDFNSCIFAKAEALRELPQAPFLNLNLANLQNSLKITVPEGFSSEELNSIAVSGGADLLQLSRVYFDIGANSQTSFWLNVATAAGGAAAPVFCMDVGAGAEFQANLYLEGNGASGQSAFVYLRQGENSRVKFNVLQMGDGAFKRLDIYTELVGSGADFQLGGVQTPQGEQVCAVHATVRHLAPGCSSHQALRGVVDGRGFGQFDGMIYVAPGAQQTDGRQDGRYILLSETAKSMSVPRLEIYADDVQCAHGSTAGYLDEEALFYLQSRGIDLATARKILLLSFLHEGIITDRGALLLNVKATVNALWGYEDWEDDRELA